MNEKVDGCGKRCGGAANKDQECDAWTRPNLHPRPRTDGGDQIQRGSKMKGTRLFYLETLETVCSRQTKQHSDKRLDDKVAVSKQRNQNGR